MVDLGVYGHRINHEAPINHDLFAVSGLTLHSRTADIMDKPGVSRPGLVFMVRMVVLSRGPAALWAGP